MKKILITGANSYVGTSLNKWLENYPNKYITNSISVRNDLWEEKDFSEYDVVMHVAGIAHIKETQENSNLYYRVNRDLAYKVAEKMKNDGVKQFVFFSSMSVYGVETGVISKDTPLKPKSNYGKSKLQAEELISNLVDDSFKVAILRPPMIYGKGCKGNYTRLASLALKVPVFPSIKNQRSMIYMGNLCEFVRILIDDNSGGIFFPQNKEYVCTSEMVKLVAGEHERKIRGTKLFNPLIIIIMRFSGLFNKVFGDLVYEKSMSEYKEDYRITDLENSIYFIEGGCL